MLKMTAGRVDMEGLGLAARAHIAEWDLKRFAEGMERAVVTAIRAPQSGL